MQLEGRIIVISGATATGKSDLAITLAEKINGTVINADALQIYQGLPILSAQPTVIDQTRVPHKLYSNLTPDTRCSAMRWLELAKVAIQETQKQQRIPIIVGGSGMYLSRLIHGFTAIPEIPDNITMQVQEIFHSLQLEKFRQLVAEVDPLSATKYLDPQKLLRAYEVFLATQRPMSYWLLQPNIRPLPPDHIQHFNLCPSRDFIYQRCNQRFQQMLNVLHADVEVQEFTKFFCQLIPGEDPATIDYRLYHRFGVTNTIGLIEITDYLRGLISKDTCIEISSQRTRHYAKRQLTWFRHQFSNDDTIYLTQTTELWKYLAI